MNIRRLIEIQCYRGMRHRRNYRCMASARTPMRGRARVREGRRRGEEKVAARK